MRRSTPARIRPGLASLAIGATCALLLLPTQAASATPAPLSQPALVSTAQPAAVDRDTKEAFVSTTAGQPIARPAGLPADAAPGIVAEAFVRGGGAGALARGENVRVAAVQAGVRGGKVVRLQRLLDGVPVLGGEAVVDVDSAGNIRSVTSETTASTTVLPADSAITAADARATALGVTARENRVAAGTLTATQPEQWVYDPRIVGVPGLPIARTVWRTEVTSNARPDIRQLVLVDAATGAVALSVNQIHEALNREVCDAGNNSQSKVPCTPELSARGEGDAAVALADVDNAYDFSGDTYDFFFNTLGRNSLDGAGMDLLSTVRWGTNYQNAFWNGEQMVYGAGFAVDDVVGHELTHGVTEFSSNLFYMYQSGAINESLSDIFGEFIDLDNNDPDVSDASRWLLGEDLPGGAIRDMKNPPAKGHPDTTDSPNYSIGTFDVGGVHINSGIGNKFAYLITDGDTFNGQTVGSLGMTKAARIIYAASQILTSGADYQVFASTLRQACATLVGTQGIVAGDCTQVDAAIKAVEMDIEPAKAVVTPAPVCATGLTPVDLFSDDMEDTSSGNWIATTAAGAGPYWFYAGVDTDPKKPGYPSGGDRNLLGENTDVTSDSAMELARAIELPAAGDVHLRFEHAFQFDAELDSSLKRYWDGGIVEYSTDGGPWVDAKDLMTEGGYNDLLQGVGNNPLAGRDAFVGVSDRTSARADLTSLLGKSVKFRFRIGTDSLVGGFGWFVDNVRIYSCATAPDAPTLSTLTPGAGSLAVSATLGGDGGSAVTAVQYRLDGGTWTSSGQATGNFTISGLQASTTYLVEVRAANAVGVGATSNALTATTLAAPVVNPPTSGSGGASGGGSGSGSGAATPDPVPTPAQPVETVPTPITPPEATPPATVAPTVTVTTVAARADARKSELRVVMGPSEANPRAFRVQVRTASGKWRTLPRTFTSRPSGKASTIDLPKGVYRVLVPATGRYSAETSSRVRLAR